MSKEKKGQEAAPIQPDGVLAVAVKRDGKWYQIVIVLRLKGETKEAPGRRTDNKLIAAEWLSAALLETKL